MCAICHTAELRKTEIQSGMSGIFEWNRPFLNPPLSHIVNGRLHSSAAFFTVYHCGRGFARAGIHLLFSWYPIRFAVGAVCAQHFQLRATAQRCATSEKEVYKPCHISNIDGPNSVHIGFFDTGLSRTLLKEIPHEECDVRDINAISRTAICVATKVEATIGYAERSRRGV